MFGGHVEGVLVSFREHLRDADRVARRVGRPQRDAPPFLGLGRRRAGARRRRRARRPAFGVRARTREGARQRRDADARDDGDHREQDRARPARAR